MFDWLERPGGLVGFIVLVVEGFRADKAVRVVVVFAVETPLVGLCVVVEGREGGLCAVVDVAVLVDVVPVDVVVDFIRAVDRVDDCVDGRAASV